MPVRVPPASRPLIVLSANDCWNLVHFRSALIDGLQRAGYRLAAFARRDRHADALAKRGVELFDVPVARAGLNPAAEARLLFNYFRLLRKLRPAALCAFTIKPNIYGAIAGRLAGVPVINNVTGLGTAFLDEGALWALSRNLYRFAFRSPRLIFFHNQTDLAAFAEAGIIAPGQGWVIPGSGVDLEHFRPLPGDRVPSSPPTFLFVGRMLADKGVREYIAAARTLRQRLPEARFCLLGSLDPLNRTTVSVGELAAWRAEGVVEFLGEQADVRPAMRDATAVVLPSYREGLSRALLEAAALGRPLVGTDVPGVRELVEEGVTGALARPRDSDSLAAAMARIAAASPGALNALGANARRLVEDGCGEEVVVDAYIQALAAIAVPGGKAAGSH